MVDESGEWPEEYPNRHYCPYCRAMLKVYLTELEVEYEIPITPPPGARDLGLKQIGKKHEYGPTYASCSRCGAKYEFRRNLSSGYYCSSVEEIPDKDTLLNEFVKGLPQSARVLKAGAKRYVPDPNHRNPQYGECFIATSIYGSSDALEVQILRKFRNNFLLKNFLGKSFISFYYCLSPFLVRHLENKRKIKLFIKRVFLDPLVNLISVDERRES